MNYLAHLFLAADSPQSRIGNLAGDFVKGRLDDSIPAEIVNGIREHRNIDAFTDSHPSTAAFRRRLFPEFGHYARVIADIFYDHFLAADFERYASEPLEAFIARVHREIDEHAYLLPARLKWVYPRMRDQQWLLSYRSVKGIEIALRNTSRRLSRSPELHRSIHHLAGSSRETLSQHFHSFFPDVIRYALRLRS
ncbi:MAG TPA: ACP phosphodiesterase [Thermoanaerobaculia bacterium]|nr:ACP phosphodiesterase [Thermoanaerobaculia bacterium]